MRSWYAAYIQTPAKWLPTRRDVARRLELGNHAAQQIALMMDASSNHTIYHDHSSRPLWVGATFVALVTDDFHCKYQKKLTVVRRVLAALDFNARHPNPRGIGAGPSKVV